MGLTPRNLPQAAGGNQSGRELKRPMQWVSETPANQNVCCFNKEDSNEDCSDMWTLAEPFKQEAILYQIRGPLV